MQEEQQMRTSLKQSEVENNLIPPQELIDYVGGGDFQAIGNAILQHLIDLGGLRPTERVLDVACGCGRLAVPLTRYLVDEGSYEGFDIHQQSIRWCVENISNNFGNFKFQVANIYNKRYNPEGEIQASDYRFPYKDESFDLVFFTSLFTHLLPNDLQHYLTEIQRVLKVGGRCLGTAFLLNSESLKLLEESSNIGIEAGHQLTFNYNYGIYCVSDPNVPEAAVAYDENFMFDCYKELGLSIVEPVNYGTWCGRKQASTGQDLIVAVKSESTRNKSEVKSTISQSSPQSLPKLQLIPVHSNQEYEQLQEQEQDLIALVKTFEEKILINNQFKNNFTVLANCYICKVQSNFEVNYNYCYEVDGVKIPNWREQLVCPSCRLTNRMRASIHIFMQELKPSPQAKIYLTEQLTPLYAYLKHDFPNTIGSEYMGSAIPFGSIAKNGIRNESLTNLSFQNSEFDFILSFDVFEHIPNYRKAFSECYRVLKEQGSLLFTVPFHKWSKENIIRAELNEEGQIIHRREPIYHGDPLSDKGILCFQEFGWNLLEELREVGFNDVVALIYCSDFYGYLGGGHMVFVAKKSIPAKILPPQKTLIKAFADGHFYSPIVNTVEIEEAEARIWPDFIEILGIDFNDLNHKILLSEVFPKYLTDYDYPLEAVDETTFYVNNGQFGWCDSRILFCMLRHLQPKRMIEIGSGYTSLLTADVNRRFLKQELEFTCIEPYPREFLLKGVSGISFLIPQKVENLPLSAFSNLQRGDILFIDSSHVSKTGSDVNYLFFEVIPRLSEGVLIHIHDIFLPAEYPKEWIIHEGRSWNEQYLVRALLMYTQGFEVLFGSAYAFYKHPELLKKVLQNHLQLGGSLWLRKKEVFTPKSTFVVQQS